MTQPLIIQYTNLLHQYRDHNAKAVKEFLRKNSSNSVFMKRARVLNKIFQLKEQLVTSAT